VPCTPQTSGAATDELTKMVELARKLKAQESLDESTATLKQIAQLLGTTQPTMHVKQGRTMTFANSLCRHTHTHTQQASSPRMSCWAAA